MKIVRYHNRDIVLWKMPDGKLQPFCKSTGRHGVTKDTWIPFDGYVPHWFIKKIPYPFGKGDQCRKASQEIAKLNLPEGEKVDSGFKVNAFLESQGWSWERK